MKEITIKAPRHIDCDSKEWPAKYAVYPGVETRYIYIEARSTIEILVAKVNLPHRMGSTYYLISSPNFGIAIPDISTLQETYWITEQLLRGMPAPDAVTAAQVLANMGDF